MSVHVIKEISAEDAINALKAAAGTGTEPEAEAVKAYQKEHPTLIMVDLSGCGYCVSTLQELAKLQKRVGSTLKVIRINNSILGNTISALTHPSLVPLASILSGIRSFPTLITMARTPNAQLHLRVHSGALNVDGLHNFWRSGIHAFLGGARRRSHRRPGASLRKRHSRRFSSDRRRTTLRRTTSRRATSRRASSGRASRRRVSRR